MSNISNFTPQAPVLWVAADDNLLLVNDAEVSFTIGGYTLQKWSLACGGEIRCKFSMKALGASWPPFGKIYLGRQSDAGVWVYTAKGTERTTASTTYVEFSEDLDGFIPGDRVALYAYATASTDGYVKFLRLYGTPKAPFVAGP